MLTTSTLYVSSPGDEADRPAALLVRDPGHLTLKQIPDDRGIQADRSKHQQSGVQSSRILMIVIVNSEHCIENPVVVFASK